METIIGYIRCPETGEVFCYVNRTGTDIDPDLILKAIKNDGLVDSGLSGTFKLTKTLPGSPADWLIDPVKNEG